MALSVSTQPDPLHFDLHVEVNKQGDEERSYHLFAVQHPPSTRGKRREAPPVVPTTIACEHTFISWAELLSALHPICPLGDLEVLHSMLLRRSKAKIGSFHLQPTDLDLLGFSPTPLPGPALI
jgi:hypothetical protein